MLHEVGVDQAQADSRQGKAEKYQGQGDLFIELEDFAPLYFPRQS